MASTDDRGPARMTLDERVALAVESDELTFVYQPIARASDLTVLGVEALARLQVPGLSDLTPDVFLPMLFRLGQAEAVTRTTLRTALGDLDAVAVHFEQPELRLSLNLSAAQLRNGHSLVACVEQELARSGVNPRRITFEIVEDLSVPQRSLVAGTLASLGRLGVKLALDDFGTGRSSHEHLLDLHVDSIKIDRRFVAAAGNNRAARASTEALVGLGVSLGLEVVAEGVQSRDDIAWLAELGCDAVQGWAIGMPLELGDPAPPDSANVVDPNADDEPTTEALLNTIEKDLIEGARLSDEQAEEALALLASAPETSHSDGERAGWMRSWLLHVADGGSSAVSDHVVTAARSLRTGEVGQAGLEFSRAAVAACHSNQITATLRNVTEACALLGEDGWEQSDRFRVLYNLAWIYADVTRTTEGVDLLTGVFGAGAGHLPDYLTWAAGFTAACSAIELQEREEIETSGPRTAQPERVLATMREMSDRLDPKTPLIQRWPIVPLEIRCHLLAGRPSDEVPPMLSRPDVADVEPVTIAYWDVAEFEYDAAVADVDAAIEHSRRAIEVFATSGFYKFRILHAWERQSAVLDAAGRYREAAAAQSAVVATLRQDNFDKNVQMLGSMLDFDLQATLAAELAKTTPASG